MKKVLATLWLIAYTVIAFLPILFLGYLLGLTLLK